MYVSQLAAASEKGLQLLKVALWHLHFAEKLNTKNRKLNSDYFRKKKQFNMEGLGIFFILPKTKKIGIFIIFVSQNFLAKCKTDFTPAKPKTMLN